MGDPITTETGARAQIDKRIQAETQSVAHGVLFTEAQRKLTETSLPPHDRTVLEFGISLRELKNPYQPDIPKKDPNQEGTDLFLTGDAFQGVTIDGKPITLTPTDMRVSGVLGADPANPEKVLVLFKDKDDKDVMVEGKKFALSVARDDLLAAQYAAEPLYDTLAPTGTAGDVVKANLQAARHDRGQADAPLHMPSDNDLHAARDEYGITAPTADATEPETEEEPTTPLEKANFIIKKQIPLLEAKLKDPEFKDKEERKKIEKLLFTLRVADVANGPSGVMVKSFALEQLQDAGQGDFQDDIDSLAAKTKQAKVDIIYAIEESGLKEKDIQKLLKKFETEGMDKLLEDKKLSKMPDLTEEIFGKNFKTETFSKLIEASHLSPDQKEALKKAIDKDPKSKKTILWIILAILAIPIATPLLVGVAASKASGDIILGTGNGR